MSLPLNLDVWPYSSVDEEDETRTINCRTHLGFLAVIKPISLSGLPFIKKYLSHFNSLATVLTALEMAESKFISKE